MTNTLIYDNAKQCVDAVLRRNSTLRVAQVGPKSWEMFSADDQTTIHVEQAHGTDITVTVLRLHKAEPLVLGNIVFSGALSAPFNVAEAVQGILKAWFD